MNQFFVIKRRGTFSLEPVDSSRNQCFKVGHSLYNYHVIIAVIDKLDKKGFILEHELIDNTINHKNSLIVGSCEQMHNQMHKVLLDLPVSKNFIALKTVIYPAGIDYVAHMEKYWINSNFSYELPYIINVLMV